MQLTVINLAGGRLPLTRKEIKDIARYTLKEAKRDLQKEFSLVTVGQSEIRKLNKKYRKKDKPTDVLSFPNNEVFPGQKEKDLGDIFLCPKYIDKKVEELNSTKRKHYTELIIHGILHLLGYDHVKDKDFVQMNNLEKKVIKKVARKLKIKL